MPRRLGPTQLIPGSHRPEAAAAVDAALRRGAQPPDVCSPELLAGDALVYDQRTIHRGVPNESDRSRPSLYLSAAA